MLVRLLNRLGFARGVLVISALVVVVALAVSAAATVVALGRFSLSPVLVTLAVAVVIALSRARWGDVGLARPEGVQG